METIEIQSNERIEFIDITDRINRIIEKLGITDGVALIFTKHTTTALMINENETGLLEDIKNSLKRLVPNLNYKHDRIDNNADAHLRAILLQTSLVVPVRNSRLDLGTWQKVFLIELDGPRVRNVLVGNIEME